MQKKKKYDELMALELSEENLTGVQLKLLLSVKKIKTDKPFTTLKKKELI